MNHAPERDDLQLADYASVLRRGWWLIVTFAIVGLLGSAGYYAVSHKAYTASASVYVTATGQTANQVANGRTSSSVNLDTEAQVVQSATVAQAAAKLMHRDTGSLQALINRVSVTVPANSQVLLISCQAGSPDGAAACAQSFARAFLTYSATSTTASANSQVSALQAKVSALESAGAKLSVAIDSLPGDSSQRATDQQQLNSDQSQLGSLNSQVAQLTAELANPSGGSIITSASPPSSPSNPKKLLVVPSGLLVGLLIGLIAAFFLDRRDHRIREPRDLSKINVPVLMALPKTLSSTELGIASPRSQLGRDFARLAHVLTGSLGTGSHVILVTGACPGHGASLVAANLAVSLSRNQPDVTLVCADLEESVIPAMVGLPPGRGLTDLLAAGSPVGDAGDRVAVAPRLRVIVPGSAALAEAEDLRQDAVESLVASLRATARWIVVEAPSTMAGPDAYALAQAADSAVLVVEVPWATTDQVLDSSQYLDRMGANVLGAAVVPALKVAMPRYAADPSAAEPGSQPTAQQSGQEGQKRQNGQRLQKSRAGQRNQKGRDGRPVLASLLVGSSSDEEQTGIVDWPVAEEMPNSTPRN